MGYDGSLKFDTAIDEKGFNGGIKKLGSIAKSGLSVLGGAVAGVAAAMGTGIAAGVKYNASIEQYQTSFEVMTGSAEKAADVVERLKQVGASTPFELPELADTTQLLMNYGFTADEAMDSMMMLGDISQGNADKMSRVAAAYGQMSSAGKVSLEDVKQMIEAGFNPLQEISESTGESMESLYERISDGAISVDEITASMQRATSEGGKYFQSMEKQSQTVSGLVSTLKDNAQQLLGEVVKPITESIGTQLLPAAIGALEQLTTAFQENGVEGLIAAGGQIITNLLLGIAQALPNIITTAVQIIQSIIDNINLNLPQILSAGGQILLALINGAMTILGSLGTLAFNIISTLVSGLITNAPQMLQQGYALFTEFRDVIAARLPELIQSGVQMISNLVSGLLSAAPQVISQASSMLNGYLNDILSKLPSLMEAGVQIIQNILQGLLDNAPQIIQQCLDMMASFLTTLLDHLPDILSAGKDIILNLLEGLIQQAPDIIAQAAQMISEFLGEIASHLPEVLQKGIEIIGELLAGMINKIPDIIAAIPGMILDIGNAFLNKDWAAIGWDIITGITSGIANAASNLVNAAVNAAKDAVETVKGWLGIHSPSRRMRDEVGKYMALGMGVGFEQNIPTEEMTAGLSDSMKEIQRAAGSVTSEPADTTSQTVSGGGHFGGNHPGGSEIDYERLGDEVARAMNGTEVTLDGEKVGEVVTPAVSNHEYMGIKRWR